MLLGGTYLFLFYVGMVLGAHYKKFATARLSINIAGTILFGVFSIAVWKFMCVNKLQLDGMLPFGGGFNPPSISFSAYAFCVMGEVYFVIHLLERVQLKFIQRILKGLNYLGQHTLYIFLYHRLFLDYYLVKYHAEEESWIKWLFYFLVMIGGSLLIDKICEKLGEIIQKSYKYSPAKVETES